MLRVVLADDEKKVLLLMCKLIDWESLGFEIVGMASDGMHALEMIRDKQPHLLVTDIRMPGFDGIDLSMLTSPLLLAISLGLIIGKPLGVFGFSYLSVKLGIAKLPQGINFKQIFAVAILCGIGFTMSMFLASLAFNADAGESINSLSRLGILLGSTVSAIVGYMALKATTKLPS